MAKLSQTSHNRLIDFSGAAQNWGNANGEGSPPAPGSPLDVAYDEAWDALVQRVMSLETTNRQLRRENAKAKQGNTN